MRVRVLSVLSVAVAGLLFSVGSSAHHGASALYDLSQTVRLTGMVTEFRFTNPHVFIYFEVTGEDGTIVAWSAGLTSRNRLARTDGWNRNTLEPGERISIVGSPARDGAPSLWVEQVFVDGEPLLEVPGGAG
jgi:hypothetical protein